MKKLITIIFAIFATMTVSSQAVERAFGINLSYAGIDTQVKDDIDSNGTTDTTKDITNDVGIASIFLEVSNSFGDRGHIAFGVDYIPFSAEWESRSTTQTTKSLTASGSTSGTNKGNVEVDGHTTIYIQPGITMANDVILYGTLAYVTADAEADVQSVSSTDKTVDLSMDGTKYGFGLKKSTGFGFVKLEYASTEYDTLSTTTSNNTKVTADMDVDFVTLSIGKSF